MSSVPPTIGPYRLGEPLGSGGMGAVHRAYDARLDRWVAVKQVRPDASSDPARLRARLRREARAAARLNHPAIVQIFDILQHSGDDWIVMELVDGVTCASLVSAGPQAPELVLAIGRQVASGLAEAHSKGILHRDLKAENIMVTEAGQAKILDFGLAKPLDPTDDETQLSVVGKVVGTCRAMSPEQARGLRLTPRSDLFALGVLLYELATGDSPFQAATPADTLSRVLSHQPVAVARRNEQIPVALSQLVERLIEKAPELRPSSAAEVARELAVLAGLPPTELELSMVTEGLSEDTQLQATLSCSTAALRSLVRVELAEGEEIQARLAPAVAERLGERHDRMARELVARHEGVELATGSGLLLLFERPASAVLCLLEYRRRLRALGEEEGVPLRLRGAVHLGEVLVLPPAEGEAAPRAEGAALEVVAGLIQRAEGDEVLLTRGAFDLARRVLEADSEQEGTGYQLHWMSHGSHHLSGIAEPVEVCEVRDTGAVAVADSEATLTAAPPVAAPRRRRRGWALVAGLLLALLVALLMAGLGWQRSREASSPPASGGSVFEAVQEGTALLDRFDLEGNLERARELFEGLVERAPESAAAHAGLARAWWRSFRQGDDEALKRALPHAERAVELDGYLAAARVVRGLVRLDQDRVNEAAEDFRRALLLDPTAAAAHRGLAEVAQEAGEMETAERELRRAVELAPRDRRYLDLLGHLYFRQNRLDEAKAVFRRSVEVAPDGLYGYRNLAVIHHAQGELEEASAVLQKGLSIRPHFTLYSNLGTVLYDRELYAESAQAYRDALDLNTESWLLWNNLGDAYRRLPERAAEAREAHRTAAGLLEERVGAEPAGVDDRSRLALLKAKSGGCEAALRTAVAAVAPDAAAWYRFAVARELCGDRTGAAAALAAALEGGLPARVPERDPELAAWRQEPTWPTAGG